MWITHFCNRFIIGIGVNNASSVSTPSLMLVCDSEFSHEFGISQKLRKSYLQTKSPCNAGPRSVPLVSSANPTLQSYRVHEPTVSTVLHSSKSSNLSVENFHACTTIARTNATMMYPNLFIVLPLCGGGGLKKGDR